MSHLSSAQHETSKRDSPNELKIKKNKNKTIPDSNSNLASHLVSQGGSELYRLFRKEMCIAQCLSAGGSCYLVFGQGQLRLGQKPTGVHGLEWEQKE
jgi:hypothetical protein